MQSIVVSTQPAYTIYLGKDLIQPTLLNQLCQQFGRKIAIITDELIYQHLSSYFNELKKNEQFAHVFTFPSGEQHKTRETKAQLEDQLLLNEFGRDSVFIAIGGGVVLDLVGFLAATYMRGVPVIYIPTTLLAMVDASVGGKTGVDTPLGKNLIGVTRQPSAVVCDVSVLEKLPLTEWQNGMVETIKHAALVDANLFAQLEEMNFSSLQKDKVKLTELIAHSIAIKIQVFVQDPDDRGLRHILNFGHTIGHALETLSQYKLSHGKAVAIGMVVEAYLAEQLGYATAGLWQRIRALLHHYQMDLQTDCFSDLEKLKVLLRRDKKAQHHAARFVLLRDIGSVVSGDNDEYSFAVPESVLEDVLLWARERFLDYPSPV